MKASDDVQLMRQSLGCSRVGFMLQTAEIDALAHIEWLTIWPAQDVDVEGAVVPQTCADADCVKQVRHLANVKIMQRCERICGQPSMIKYGSDSISRGHQVACDTAAISLFGRPHELHRERGRRRSWLSSW